MDTLFPQTICLKDKKLAVIRHCIGEAWRARDAAPRIRVMDQAAEKWSPAFCPWLAGR